MDGYGQWGRQEKEVTFQLFEPFLQKNSDNLWKAITLNIKMLMVVLYFHN